MYIVIVYNNTTNIATYACHRVLAAHAYMNNEHIGETCTLFACEL